MKRRRHVLGGLLLLVVAAVLAAGDWTVLDMRVLGPLAIGVAVVGLANVVVGIGRPAAVRDKRDAVTTATALLFALLAAAIALENALAPESPLSYLLAVLWGGAAAFAGWVGTDRLRTRRDDDTSN